MALLSSGYATGPTSSLAEGEPRVDDQYRGEQDGYYAVRYPDPALARHMILPSILGLLVH
jgi:hypothetical protein